MGSKHYRDCLGKEIVDYRAYYTNIYKENSAIIWGQRGNSEGRIWNGKTASGGQNLI